MPLRYFRFTHDSLLNAPPRMRTLRSTWSRRWLVALLMTTLLPLVLGPFADSGADSTDVRTEWLRAQVAGPMTDDARSAFESALEEAQDAAGPSLEAFTAAFASAYVQQSPDLSLSALFDVPSSGENGLYRALHQRAQQLGSRAAVFPRITGPSPTPVTSTARMAVLAGRAAAQWMLQSSWEAMGGSEVDRLPASLTHLLCAVQPLGP